MRHVPHISFSAQQANNNADGDVLLSHIVLKRNHFGTSSFVGHGGDGVVGGRSGGVSSAVVWRGSLGQLPPLSEAPPLISDIFPVPLSRPCRKSQLSVRLDNTCNFQSGFSANINPMWSITAQLAAKAITFIKPPHCDVERSLH